MNRYWMLSAFAMVAVVGSFWSLKSIVKYKPSLPRGLPKDATAEDFQRIVQQNREAKQPSPREMSKAVVPETEFNFGLMDPNTELQHEFVIRNEGTDTLRLGDPRANCHCANIQLSAREIIPGGSATATMHWTPEDKVGAFGVGVRVPTSDPDRAEIEFVAHGVVRQRLEALPSAMIWGDVAPDGIAGAREAIVYSQVWDDFTIEKVECPLAGAQWSIDPATTSELQRIEGAKSGFRLTLTLPENPSKGAIDERLVLWARVQGQDELLPYSMAVSANVRGRLSIHGSAIDEQGVVELGTIARHEGKQSRLLVKVRDAQKDLPNVRFEIEPAFVTARLSPQGAASGLYALDIEVPKDAPAEVHLRPDQWGTLIMRTDHPRIPETKLRLRFAVAGREAVALP